MKEMTNELKAKLNETEAYWWSLFVSQGESLDVHQQNELLVTIAELRTDKERLAEKLDEAHTYVCDTCGKKYVKRCPDGEACKRHDHACVQADCDGQVVPR